MYYPSSLFIAQHLYWDFLVVVDRTLTGAERRRITARLLVALARAGIPADIILLSGPQFQRYREDVGHIAYYAVREGYAL